MSKVGYFRLGLFVVLGTLLTSSLIVVLGAGQVFQRVTYFETYVDESVQGLSVGSPVKYRGVQIGSVEDIGLCREVYGVEPKTEEGRWVYIKIALVRRGAVEGLGERSQGREFSELIRQGFRVRLASQGITGLAYIEADFLDPDEYPPFENIPWRERTLHFYVPAARSTMYQLTESLVTILGNLEAVKFQEIGESLNSLLETFDTTVKDANVGELSAEVRIVLKEVREILESQDVNQTFDNVKALTGEVREAVKNARPELKTLVTMLNRATEQFDALMAELRSTVKRDEVERLIQELPGAASQLKLSLKRVNAIMAINEEEVQTIVNNLGTITEDLRGIVEQAKKYPSRVIFGEAPKPVLEEASE